MLQLILFNVTNGLIIGAFYVLMALGLSMILNLSNVINFAHGRDHLGEPPRLYRANQRRDGALPGLMRLG